MRVVLTAGYYKAKHVIALAELLSRDGVEIAGILVVNPYSIKRLKSLLKQRGLTFILIAIKKMIGLSHAKHKSEKSPLENYIIKNKITYRSLIKWCNDNNIKMKSVPSLNHSNAVQFIKTSNLDGVLYGGGGILKSKFIKAARGKILNAHSGPLPEIRGMNACEWSILLGKQPMVTIHFIDEGIDTGYILKKLQISIDNRDTIQSLREKCVVQGIMGLRSCVAMLKNLIPESSANVPNQRQCFIMAPVLKSILEMKIQSYKDET